MLEMKFVGKPYAGKPHVRFDEGERVKPFSTLPPTKRMGYFFAVVE